jgi:hypothetical protein
MFTVENLRGFPGAKIDSENSTIKFYINNSRDFTLDVKIEFTEAGRFTRQTICSIKWALCLVTIRPKIISTRGTHEDALMEYYRIQLLSVRGWPFVHEVECPLD